MENYTQKEIKLYMYKVLRETLKRNLDKENIDEEMLLGINIKLETFELAYLLMEVKKYFSVEISEEDFFCPGVRTINDIAYIVEKNKTQ